MWAYMFNISPHRQLAWFEINLRAVGPETAEWQCPAPPEVGPNTVRGHSGFGAECVFSIAASLLLCQCVSEEGTSVCWCWCSAHLFYDSPTSCQGPRAARMDHLLREQASLLSRWTHLWSWHPPTFSDQHLYLTVIIIFQPHAEQIFKY